MSQGPTKPVLDAIRILNEALEADPQAISRLMLKTRVT